MKKIQLIVLVLFLGMSFMSCKKTLINEDAMTVSQEQSNIITWLASQKINNTDTRVKQIDVLEKNLLYDKLWTEKNDNLQFIIVPISESQKFANNNGKKITSYFVSVISATSKILYSVIIQYKPTNLQKALAIKQGAIADMYSNKPLEEDCNVRFITIYDYYLYAKNYKSNKLFSTVNINKKVSSNNSNFAQSNLDNLCYEWGWLTTYENGSQTWEPLYITCDGGGGGGTGGVQEEEQCINCGSGSGPELDPGTPSPAIPVIYILKEIHTSYQDLKIVVACTISGTVFNDISKNVFTSITYNGSACLNYMPANSTLPYMPWYFVFHEVSHSSGLLGPMLASASASTTMFYPNIPNTDLYSLGHLWQASTDLHL